MNASRQDYFSFAARHAGIYSSGYGTTYINVVGAYNSSFNYNQHQMQLSRNPVLYTGKQAWRWDTAKNRIRFKELRERELDFENNTKYCVAGILLNHFISALHASKMVRQMDSAESSLTFHVINSGLSATITRYF